MSHGGWCFDTSYRQSYAEYHFRVRQAGSKGHFYKRDGLDGGIVARSEAEALKLFLGSFDLSQAWEIMVCNKNTGEVRLVRVEPPVPVEPRITNI